MLVNAALPAPYNSSGKVKTHAQAHTLFTLHPAQISIYVFAFADNLSSDFSDEISSHANKKLRKSQGKLQSILLV